MRRAMIGMCLAGMCLFLHAGEGKVLVVDLDIVMRQCDEGVKLQRRLDAFSEETARTKALYQDEIRKLSKQAEEQQADSAALAQLERDYQQKAIRLQRYHEDREKEVAELRGQGIQKIEAEVIPVLETIMKEEGCTVLFQQGSNELAWSRAELDITQRVLARLKN